MNTCDCNKPKCAPSKCRTDGFVFRKVVIPAQLGDDKTGQEKPENGAMTNSFVTYEANGAQYIYDSFGVYTKFSGEVEVPVLSVNGKTGVVVLTTSDLENDSDYVTGSYVAEAIGLEAGERIAADGDLQSQIDALAAASDVTDIVGTHAELEAYDTSKLKNNDIIKVLQDETQDDETTYYRWSTSTEEFTLIGAEGPYYTKAAADTKFQDKLTAGDHITINSSNEISADGQTIFYANSQETGATRHIYKDAAFTQAASAQDLLDANEEGPVVLRITINPNPNGLFSDAYIQNTYVGEDDYQFLFLDERTYREYAASAPSDTTFYYFSNTIQSQLTAGDNITINSNTISSKATKRYYFDSTSATPVYADSAETTAVTGQALYDAFQNNLVTFKDLSEQGLGWEPEYILEVATDTGSGMRLFVWGYYGSFMIEYSDKTATAATITPGQSGPTVVQTTGTSTTDVMSQVATSQMIYPSGSETSKDRISIGGGNIGNSSYGIAIGSNTLANNNYSIAIGAANQRSNAAVASNTGNIAIGWNAKASTDTYEVALGYSSYVAERYSVALGSYSNSNRRYEVSIGSGKAGDAATYKERYLANVKDPSLAQDAATKNYVDTKAIGADEAYAIADTDWTALPGASPYTYSADVTATYAIGNDTIVELINDNPVLFSTYGFAIGAVNSQTVTIYSVGAPSSSVSLTINYKG